MIFIMNTPQQNIPTGRQLETIGFVSRNVTKIDFAMGTPYTHQTMTASSADAPLLTRYRRVVPVSSQVKKHQAMNIVRRFRQRRK